MRENDIWEINSIGQLHRFFLQGRYNMRDCARKIFEQDREIAKIKKMLDKYNIKSACDIACGEAIHAITKDEIDVLDDKLALLDEYQKFGSLKDLQEKRQNANIVKAKTEELNEMLVFLNGRDRSDTFPDLRSDEERNEMRRFIMGRHNEIFIDDEKQKSKIKTIHQPS